MFHLVEPFNKRQCVKSLADEDEVMSPASPGGDTASSSVASINISYVRMLRWAHVSGHAAAI